MDEREFEQLLGQLMKLDLSAGTEAFRDELLSRCLAVLDADSEGMVLGDADLDMLAAAGTRFAFDFPGMDSLSRIGDNKDAENLL